MHYSYNSSVCLSVQDTLITCQTAKHIVEILSRQISPIIQTLDKRSSISFTSRIASVMLCPYSPPRVFSWVGGCAERGYPRTQKKEVTRHSVQPSRTVLFGDLPSTATAAETAELAGSKAESSLFRGLLCYSSERQIR